MLLWIIISFLMLGLGLGLGLALFSDYLVLLCLSCLRPSTTHHTVTWLLCAFSMVVDRDQLTHTDGVKSTLDNVSRFVFLFPFPKNPSINHLNFYCWKQIDNIFLCVYCSSHATPLSLVSYFSFFTCCDVICDLLQYRRENIIYLLNNIHVYAYFTV